MDIVWDGDRLFVAGPDTGPAPGAPDAPFVVGIRFRPGAGPMFLGVPAYELVDARVDLADMWRDADELQHRLEETASLRDAAGVLERYLTLREHEGPDPVVEAILNGLDTGLSERQVHRRFLDAVGYGPKFLQRVLRFQAFLNGAIDRKSLSALTYELGFADQSHLNRETQKLAGRTPKQLRDARV
jgi:AraC-like DNA-binding protein